VLEFDGVNARALADAIETAAVDSS